MSALPNDYDSDPERFLSSGKYPHDDVHPYVATRLARACARRALDVGGVGTASWHLHVSIHHGIGAGMSMPVSARFVDKASGRLNARLQGARSRLQIDQMLP